jgi:hypothetical protein
MKRSLFLRVLLSLLLLVSQQMAVSHAMSHWTGTADKSAHVQVDSKHKPSKGLDHELGCSQCFAYAQMESAIGTSAYALPVVDVRPVHLALLVSSADCIRTVCVFQSRAPPQA